MPRLGQLAPLRPRERNANSRDREQKQDLFEDAPKRAVERIRSSVNRGAASAASCLCRAQPE